MKRLALTLAAAVAVASASALPKAIYVKQGDEISKYNFGVADDLVFSENGTKLTVKGYGETIDLNAIDYISFSAPLGSALTPSEQKQKLVDIGQEAYSMIDLNDQADILKMSHDFFDSDASFVAPVEFWLDPEYYDVHGEFGDVVKAMVATVSGDASAARSLKSKAVNLYKIEDYFGIYTADRAAEKWVKTPADHLEVRFSGRDGSTYTWRCDASADYTTWTTSDFDGRFPRTLDITVSKGDKRLAAATLKTELKQSESIDMTLDFEANGYVVSNVLNVTDSRIDDKVNVTVKGKSYVVGTSTISGRNFVNYNVIYDAVKAANGYYDDNDEWVYEDATDLVACFSRAQAEVDVIGKLQVKGRIAAPSKVYAELNQDEVDSTSNGALGRVLKNDGESVHIAYDEPTPIENQAECLNNYTDVGFYYDGRKTLQGYLAMTCGEEISEGWNGGDSEVSGYTIVDGMLISVYRDYDDSTQQFTPWYYRTWDDESQDIVSRTVADSAVIHPAAIYNHYYELEPLLLFPDGTSFAVETFFDRASFSRLIDDYNEIIDTYLSITGQTRDEEIPEGHN